MNDNAVTRAAKGASGSRTSELLAKYCDMLLKKGAVISSEEDLEQQLNSVMAIFKVMARIGGSGGSQSEREAAVSNVPAPPAL